MEQSLRPIVTVDGNEAATYVAFRASEVIAIYPITPATPMGELSDLWSSGGMPNVWGTVPKVVEMQSEGGAAGAVHGALQAGALTTTFTASQGLLLMIPNMFKLAGELTAAVIHVACRSIATHALSIFGDHSDIMAARSTGFAMLMSASPQEAMDLALVAHAATLRARIPFVHGFDGFRTSHEIQKIESLTEDDIRAMLPEELIREHRGRALNPEHPVIRGTAQNPDAFFQSREAANPWYLACPEIVQTTMDTLAAMTGRPYKLFDYAGSRDAERVIVLMGSGCGAAEEAVELMVERGEKVGLVKVRLFRPFSGSHLVAAFPPSVTSIAVLDRTKEPGSVGEPLYQDVLTAIVEALGQGEAPFLTMPKLIGGRYGLSSKEFTPAMVKGIFDELAKERPKVHFTIGIRDDVTHTSLEPDHSFDSEDAETIRAVFFGLGSDGTVGANKSSIKIIGSGTDHYAQGFFVYDSKKEGGMTTSHLRFGPRPIRATYLITQASFVACHQSTLLYNVDVLASAGQGATFLLNTRRSLDTVWENLPRNAQQHIKDKRLTVYVVNAYDVAQDAGLGRRINVVMQVCFFALSEVLPREEAIAAIKASIPKTYGKHGHAVVTKNLAAVDATLAHLYPLPIPSEVTQTAAPRSKVSSAAPQFVRDVTAKLMAGEGDLLPVSAFPPDGTFPVDTAKWEKRNFGRDIPSWNTDMCIQCGKCVIVCPHSAIRAKVVTAEQLTEAPTHLKHAPAKWRSFKDDAYLLQVAPDDCTGCTMCVEICPVTSKDDDGVKALNMHSQEDILDQERTNWDFFTGLGATDRRALNRKKVKDVQLLEPLFEFPGACAGCGETPYLKLVTQLFGDRALIANATGCSSIYGGNLPTTPWSTNSEGRGPAWSNSLFEDNAEFGLGMRLATDQLNAHAQTLVRKLSARIGDELVAALLHADQTTEEGIETQRERVAALRSKLEPLSDGGSNEERDRRDLHAMADALVKRSVWIVGGDGWAYDIGFGGVDHVIASTHNVNILVLDTEVYSNTGGQCSKATPLGATAKFAAAGKPTPKKDLALMAMSYGTAYVARIAMGGSDRHTLGALLEAESFDGPSLLLAYSPCIAHGYDLGKGMEHSDLAVKTGYWPLYRFDPRRADAGKNPFQLDSKPPTLELSELANREQRWARLGRSQPELAERLLEAASENVRERYDYYAYLAGRPAGS